MENLKRGDRVEYSYRLTITEPTTIRHGTVLAKTSRDGAFTVSSDEDPALDDLVSQRGAASPQRCVLIRRLEPITADHVDRVIQQGGFRATAAKPGASHWTWDVAPPEKARELAAYLDDRGITATTGDAGTVSVAKSEQS